ncbi:AraC family transcriptional regulator ligand-binding domain-containing protein [Steroidobacter flavus]|uniref:AraC family transcriptional regulator ligand-binding domain-containing protein n=1 Tax=Steroidobacter flavus TaxID=1842136 RepID=A0ABV8T503_9GAMM
MFRPSKLRTHLLQAQQAGYCPDEILDGSGISWREIESLQPLDLDTIATLFDYLARRTPPGFAIRAGYESKVRNYGIVGFATMSMPTLRHAFDYWSRYYLVSGDPIITSVSEHGDEWRMDFRPRCRMSTAAQHFCVETSIAALEPVIEELTDSPPGTLGIDFSSERPATKGAYGIFRTRNLRFNQESTAYYGKRRDLDRPIPSSDADVSEMFLRQCDEFLAELTSTRSTCERLEDLMRASVGSIPSLEEMASALGTSIRSLQRELSAAGIGYQELVKRYRIRHAKLLLREKRPNVKEIAYMLGFKDAGSFRRAFREWTGESVGTWQRSMSARSQSSPAERNQVRVS